MEKVKQLINFAGSLSWDQLAQDPRTAIASLACLAMGLAFFGWADQLWIIIAKEEIVRSGYQLRQGDKFPFLNEYDDKFPSPQAEALLKRYAENKWGPYLFRALAIFMFLCAWLQIRTLPTLPTQRASEQQVEKFISRGAFKRVSIPF